MTRPADATRSGLPSRRGFTLVELLIVMAIIIVLAGLVTVASVGFIGRGRASRTTTTIEKAAGVIDERIAALDRFQQGEASRGDGVSARGRKDLVRITFPVTVTELKNSGWAPATLPSGLGEPSTGPSAYVGAAEIFYYVLVNGPTYGADRAVADLFPADSQTDSDDDGHPELIDGWGQHLRFYRWPTRLVRSDGVRMVLMPGAPSPSPGATVSYPNVDPDDPVGTMGAAAVQQFHDPETWHAPLLVSAGPDGALGLYEPTDIANKGHLGAVSDAEATFDDLTSHNTRAGGL